MDHKSWLASQVPPAKYDNSNLKLTKPRLRGFSFRGNPTTADSTTKSLWIIPKMNEPGPGSYNAPEAQTKAQWAKVKGTSRQTSNPPCFTDAHKKRFAHVPGSGHYK